MNLFSCDREAAREVVLYTSCDDYLLRQIVPVFEAQSGIAVRVVGDTEATKTTGLVARLLAEKDRPRADVWWSNEPFGTIRLDGAGALEPYTSAAERDFPGGWPRWLRAADRTWYGFALRCRALAYNTKRVSKEQAPAELAALIAPEWKGRIGMARPQFGTTRGHMGAILADAGEDAFRAWVAGLKANGVRLYDGNSSVVRALANGEIDVCPTDSDDVYAGQKQGWPLEQAWLPFRAPAAGPPVAAALPIPNTVALVKGAPHGAEGRALIDFLLSERVERMLAESDSRNAPIHPGLAGEFPALAVKVGRGLDLVAISARIPRALEIWDEVFGR